MDDMELRDRLKALDPMHPGVATRSVTDEASRRQLEDIVEGTYEGNASTSRTVWYAVAAAAVVAIAVGAALVMGSGTTTEEPFRLELAQGDPMAMCIAISAEELAKLPVAFEGTATSVEGDDVTLDVTQWFRGGDAAQVALTAPQGLEALIAGIAFEEGQTYLITATDGVVNYCGFSDVASPELRALYEEAFS
jgi:hypothetical protein